jgi:lipocalin
MNKAALALLTTLLVALASYNVDFEELKTLTLGDKKLQQQPPKTVDHVDLDRYMGVWHEIAAIPAFFERGCEKTYQKFSRTNDGKIKIDNVCSSSKGNEHDAIGYAFPDPKDSTHSNSKLKLKMPPYPG